MTPRADGFDLAVDMGGQRWLEVLGAAGVTRSFVHHVRVDEVAGTFSVTDDYREVRWRAGVPTLAASATRMQGRVVSLARQRVWALGEDGWPERVGDLRFDSEEGRELVTATALGLGLRERRGAAERIGLAAAVVGGVGALVALVALVAGLVLGKFS
ncbi:MAG: hypothetical protein R2731_10035 [Nocardioides sp.]